MKTCRATACEITHCRAARARSISASRPSPTILRNSSNESDLHPNPSSTRLTAYLRSPALSIRVPSRSKTTAAGRVTSFSSARTLQSSFSRGARTPVLAAPTLQFASMPSHSYWHTLAPAPQKRGSERFPGFPLDRVDTTMSGAARIVPLLFSACWPSLDLVAKLAPVQNPTQTPFRTSDGSR
jgi:hypothetical protein